jgi:hypothetical protein
MTKATDWLFDQLWDTPKDKFTWYALLKEANEMHEQQIIDAYKVDVDEYPTQLSERAEQYYNETFKKD